MRDAAGTLDRTYVDAKKTLTAPRLEECGFLRFQNRGVGGDFDFGAPLPFLDVRLGRGGVAFYLADFITDIGNRRCLLADEPERRRCEPTADLRQVDTLQTIPIRRQRGILVCQF